MMTDTEAFVALNMLPHVGPVRVRRLLEIFGSPQGILEAKPKDLRNVQGIGHEVAESIISWALHSDPVAEIECAVQRGAAIITQSDSRYPPLLREIHAPPIVLYVWGDLRNSPAIAVVGTRKPSHYAAESAKKLAYQLAYAGLTVVSGLARGIDTAAHQAALAAKGTTIAVLGSGLDHLYPPENRELAEKIACSGAVITEFSDEDHRRPADFSHAKSNRERNVDRSPRRRSRPHERSPDKCRSGCRAGPIDLCCARANRSSGGDGLQSPDPTGC